MKRKSFKRVAILLCFALVMTAFCTVPAMAKSSSKLMKQYTWKEYNYNTKTWDTIQIKKFKYNKKGNPVKETKITWDIDDGKQITDVKNIKYKYKKGVKKTATESFNEETTVRTYNKKGAPVKTLRDDTDYTYLDKYKFKSRYATYHYDQDNITEGPITSTETYKVKTKKGYPVKITWKSGAETMTADFNKKGKKKGLIKQVKENLEYSDAVYKFNYKIKKGKVIRAEITTVRHAKDEGKTYNYKDRFDFKYAKKKMGKKRYNSMINSVLAYGAGCDRVITYWY